MYLSLTVLLLSCVHFSIALTPQVVISMVEGVSNWNTPPAQANRKLISRKCLSSYSSAMTNLSSSVNDLLISYRQQLDIDFVKFCVVQLVKPNVILSEFDLKDVDWSENFTILGTVFGSFSTYCKESEIQNFHFYPATDSQRRLDSPVYAKAHCEESSELGTGFYVTIGLTIVLASVVIVGSVLDLRSNSSSDKKREKRKPGAKPYPRWRSFARTPKDWNNTFSVPNKRSLPKILITNTREKSTPTCEEFRKSRSDSPSFAGHREESLSSLSNSTRSGLCRSQDTVIRRSPSCSPINNLGIKNLHRVVITPSSSASCSLNATQQNWCRSQSFNNVSSIESNRVSSNFSDPSLFVSSLLDSEKYVGSKKTFSLQPPTPRDERLSSTSATPSRGKVKTLLNALVMSSARRGARKIYRSDSEPSEPSKQGPTPNLSALVFVRSFQTIALWFFMLYNTAVFLGSSQLLDNPEDFKEYLPNMSSQLILNGFVHISTMFFSSAVLSAYAAMYDLQNCETLGDHIFVLLTNVVTKFLRQFPVYALIILNWTFVVPSLSYGPVWYAVRNENCYRYWWSSLFYLNNFLPEKAASQCMPWTWYPACEMQMYILGLPIILVISRYRRAGFVCMVSTIVSMSIASICISYKQRLHVSPIVEYRHEFKSNFTTMMFNDSTSRHGGWSNKVFDFVLNKPYFNWNSYVLGLVSGCYFFLKREFRMTKTMKVIGSTLYYCALPALAYISISTYSYFDENPQGSSQVSSSLYLNMIPKVWSVCLIIVLAHLYTVNRKHPVKSFLSGVWWSNMGRLNFAVNILHPAVLSVLLFSVDYPLHFSMNSLAVYFLASTLMTYVSAVALMIFGHYPLITISRLILESIWPKNGDDDWKASKQDLTVGKQSVLEENSNVVKLDKDIQELCRASSSASPGFSRLEPSQHKDVFQSKYSPVLRTQYYSPI